MKHPIQILMDEHQVILSVLSVFERNLAPSRELNPETIASCLDFFRDYADACHHGKEEDQLFPLMEARGVPREGGPIGCMLKEHDFGRACLAAVRNHLPQASSGDEAALRAVRDAGMAYANMLRQHIDKEDQILFQMAMRALSPEDFATLSEGFNDPSNPKIAQSVSQHYEALASSLAAA